MMHVLFSYVVAAIVYASPAPAPASPTPPPPPSPAASGVAWTTTEIAQLRREIDAHLRSPNLHGAQIGFIATDTVRGTVLYTQNADQEFTPASSFKLLVGSAALQRLGPQFAFTTTVGADAPATLGIIHGSVYLRGGGDALLDAKDLDDAATSLAAQGITRIDGDIVTDATRYDEQRYGLGWSWDDFPYSYAPVISALELEDGTVHMTLAPGANVGDVATLRVWPESTAYTLDNRLTTSAPSSKDTSDFERVWDQPRTIAITGSYPISAKESDDLSPSVPDPESYTGDVFKRSLAAHNIALSGTVRSGMMPRAAVALWTHKSAMFAPLLAEFWQPSDNLIGELLLKELGVAQAGEPGTAEHGRMVEQTYLRSIGVDPSVVTIADGSGLSQYDRITPRTLHAILQADWNGPYRKTVLDALPIAGVRGTLKDSFKGLPAERVVFAKTGSMSHVRTISGFVQTKTHGPVTFSLLINQWMGGDTPSGAVLSEFARR
jgi:D-alanyl-D-alanine carboxypeptidase/D-alanyl-D-alanine-endopeptidase (penicillin-binding protein 4)